MRGPDMEADMARLARELKAIEVQRLTRAGRHCVGVVPGLYLQVREPNESSRRSCRTWVLRAIVGGRLGRLPGGHTGAGAPEGARGP
jgi:hypothetical protein